MTDNKLNVTPTGCPGPIPGTKLWHCDGINCVYKACYTSCKKAIEERGYKVILTDDLIKEQEAAAEMTKQSLERKLDEIMSNNERRLALMMDEKAFLVTGYVNMILEQDERIRELERKLSEVTINEELMEATDTSDCSGTVDSNGVSGSSSDGETVD